MVSVRNRIIQNLNSNGACARNGYQAFLPPPPNQKAWGRGYQGPGFYYNYLIDYIIITEKYIATGDVII